MDWLILCVSSCMLCVGVGSVDVCVFFIVEVGN